MHTIEKQVRYEEMTAIVVYLTAGGFCGLALGSLLTVLWVDNCSDQDNCTCSLCEDLRDDTQPRTEG